MFPAFFALLGVAGISWWLYRRDNVQAELEPTALAALPAQSVGSPFQKVAPAEATPQNQPVEQPAAPMPPQLTASPAEPLVIPVQSRGPDALLESGRQALARNDLIAARKSFSQAWSAGLSGAVADEVRRNLIKIGDEATFSPRILPSDELVDRYVIKPGDSLARIATQHAVTADLIAAINGIADKHRIREGQTLKVIRGPFHAVVHKRAYRLDVYVGDVLVHSYPVGLGMDDSTPTGEWRVKNKLENPTYYPPRGGAIISADDPANPLGERWIGLEGVSGEAMSQERYGIHGTNDPMSIGKSVSLGCVRMQNSDVEQVYTYLVEGKSTVTIVEE